MKFMIMRNKIRLLVVFLLSGCTLAPGMHMETKSSWVDNEKYVFVDSLNKNIRLVDISETRDYFIQK